MPQISTQYFGTIEYSEESVISVPAGLPGFGGEKRFLIVEQPANKPLVFLQSLNSGGPCFLTVPVRVVDPNFQPKVEAEDLEVLGLPPDRQPVIGAEVLMLAILSLDEKEPPTANLLAPVAINLKSRRGVQAVQSESGYSHRHPLTAAEGNRC